MRKKAKYLHDAPNEALMPGIGAGHFQYANPLRQGEQRSQPPSYPGLPANNVYAPLPVAAPAYTTFSPTGSQGQVPPGLPDLAMNSQSYGSQQSPLSARFNPASGSQTASMQSLAEAIQHATPTDTAASLPTAFGTNFLDPNDSSQYNFDPASFNFGNHYGALEFGMLGHMSSGAAETPPSDVASHISQSTGNLYTSPGTMPTTYGDSPVNVQPYLFNQDQVMGDWRNAPQSNMRQTNQFNPNVRNQGPSNGMIKQEAPYAFTIGAGPSSLTSPNSNTSPRARLTSHGGSPPSAAKSSTNFNDTSQTGPQVRSAQQRLPNVTESSSEVKLQSTNYQRTRDSSIIYDSVTQPYSYTTGFHSLTAFLQRRFSPQKTLRIAKALASIRPSFISCTKTLNRDDLIFMEKCFQRTLWEYEDFINACGTPTLVCRRTGEVAAVGTEFSILTGWTKSVLLGKEPNLNVNTGGTSGQPGTGASSRGGMNTPRMPEGSIPDVSRPQPVFLAELLDDDSVIEFYEDFARLAFGDPRGSVTTKCKLLKYKAKENADITPDDTEIRDDGTGLQIKRKRNTQLHGKGEIAGEAAIAELGDKDGKVECSYCWTVKRDVFDIPMLIVMNVSDVLSRNSDGTGRLTASRKFLPCI